MENGVGDHRGIKDERMRGRNAGFEDELSGLLQALRVGDGKDR